MIGLLYSNLSRSLLHFTKDSVLKERHPVTSQQFHSSDRTGFRIPLEPQNCFWASIICNCLSYFITVRITFTSILHPLCTHMIFIIYTSEQNSLLFGFLVLLILSEATAIVKRHDKSKESLHQVHT